MLQWLLQERLPFVKFYGQMWATHSDFQVQYVTLKVPSRIVAGNSHEISSFIFSEK